MITVHHLNFSRSNRILWLLEELGQTYNLVRHQRDANFRAPPELMAVHPLGKAPVIQDGDLVLAESAVILHYIDTRYGKGRFSPAPASDAYFLHEEWLQYAESTAAFPIMMMRIGELTGGLSPRLEQFVRPTLNKTLEYIGGALRGAEYLAGDRLMLADIQMAYPLEIAKQTGLLSNHRSLLDYLDRLKSRAAFVRAVEIGGPMLPPN
jgi:glutathione S-transferase